MEIKDEVLLTLLQAGTTVSGSAIAGKLKVTRNAVWKAVEQLRSEGHDIEAVTNRGYRLRTEADVLSQAGILRWMETRDMGRRMEIHTTIDSTNTRAKTLAGEGAPHGMLVAAAGQTGGRGRMGRQFFSPEHSGIYISFVLRPQVPADKAVMITSMAAVAVARAIESLTEAEVKIKWVNDLYINGRKVCGILSEAGMDIESGRLEYAVLGIGVNVGPIDFPAELREIATSIYNETGVCISGNRLIAAIANQLEPLYDDLVAAEFMDEYRARSNVIGREVMVLRGSEQFEATAEGIDEQGRLLVRTGTGLEYMASGEISLKLKGVHY